MSTMSSLRQEALGSEASYDRYQSNTLEKEIFDLAHRKRTADVKQHPEADHLAGAIEITEGLSHPPRLRIAASSLRAEFV